MYAISLRVKIINIQYGFLLTFFVNHTSRIYSIMLYLRYQVYDLEFCNLIAVCIAVLNEVIKELPSGTENKPDKISEKIREVCGGKKDKDNKFVGYIHSFINNIQIVHALPCSEVNIFVVFAQCRVI